MPEEKKPDLRTVVAGAGGITGLIATAEGREILDGTAQALVEGIDSAARHGAFGLVGLAITHGIESHTAPMTTPVNTGQDGGKKTHGKKPSRM